MLDILKRKNELLESEKDNPIKTWWLSFCDPDKPKGTQFLGVIIVDAKGLFHAHHQINMLGINPGGEIQCFDISKIDPPIKDRYKNRLLTKEECEEATGEKCISLEEIDKVDNNQIKG